MPKRIITVDDTLPDLVEACLTEFKELLDNYYNENKDNQDKLTFEIAHSKLVDEKDEIIEEHTPEFYTEIRTAWFLHENELIEAFNRAEYDRENINPFSDDGQRAIRHYLEQQVDNWVEEEGDGFWYDMMEAKEEDNDKFEELEENINRFESFDEEKFIPEENDDSDEEEDI